MEEIYGFLGLEPFTHDFENVELEADEFDRKMGAPGLHAVRRRVEPSTRALSLPPDLVARFNGSQFWGDPARNPRNVRVLRPDPARAAAATP
jgi:sulfotransferase